MSVGARFFFWWIREGGAGTFVAPSPAPDPAPASPYDLVWGTGRIGINWGTTIIDWPGIG